MERRTWRFTLRNVTYYIAEDAGLDDKRTGLAFKRDMYVFVMNCR